MFVADPQCSEYNGESCFWWMYPLMNFMGSDYAKRDLVRSRLDTPAVSVDPSSTSATPTRSTGMSTARRSTSTTRTTICKTARSRSTRAV